MDVISWFWHPMALYVGFLFLCFVGAVTVFALILRGSSAKPSALPGEEPGTPPSYGPPPPYGYPAARAPGPAHLAPGQLPTAPHAGGHVVPFHFGGRNGPQRP